MKIIDTHCHIYAFDENYIKHLREKFIVVGVSDDIDSIFKVIEISKRYNFIIPSVGYHPWKIKRGLSVEEKSLLYDVVNKNDVKVLGEIGLDKKFVKETFDKQVEVFMFFLNLAKEFDLSVNIHAPDAWRDVLDLIIKHDIDRAYIHWYTGPLELIDDIIEHGYFIGINPAYKLQKKHKSVLEYAPLKNILIESDGPYNYRGMFLEPKILESVVEEISNIKKVSKDNLLNILERNFEKFIG